MPGVPKQTLSPASEIRFQRHREEVRASTVPDIKDKRGRSSSSGRNHSCPRRISYFSGHDIPSAKRQKEVSWRANTVFYTTAGSSETASLSCRWGRKR